MFSAKLPADAAKSRALRLSRPCLISSLLVIGSPSKRVSATATNHRACDHVALTTAVASGSRASGRRSSRRDPVDVSHRERLAGQAPFRIDARTERRSRTTVHEPAPPRHIGISAARGSQVEKFCFRTKTASSRWTTSPRSNGNSGVISREPTPSPRRAPRRDPRHRRIVGRHAEVEATGDEHRSSPLGPTLGRWLMPHHRRHRTPTR